MANILPFINNFSRLFYFTILIFIPYMSFSQNEGSIDTTFGNNGIVITSLNTGFDYAWDIALSSDGGFYVCGNASEKIAIVKYHQDGDLDNSFGNNGIAKHLIGSPPANLKCIQVLDDGKIVGSGNVTFNGHYTFLVTKHLSDGSLDMEFGDNGYVITNYNDYYMFMSSMLVQNDGKIIVAGKYGSYVNDLAMIRYLPNGELDTDFGANGIVITDVGGNICMIEDIVIDNDDKIIAVGKGQDNMCLVRYLPDGSVDMEFGNNGFVFTQFGSSSRLSTVTLYPDGKILTAGFYQGSINTMLTILRYLPDGSLDPLFGTNGSTFIPTGCTVRPSNIILQPDNEIYVSSTSYLGGWRFYTIFKLTANGLPDDSFGNGGKVNTYINNDDYCNGIVFQKDDKLLAAGHTMEDGSRSFSIVRYLGDFFVGENFSPVAEDNPTLFPVPATDYIKVNKSETSPLGNIRIFDINGKLVINIDDEPFINIENLSPGVYVLRSSNGFTQKFIKK
jgi:uncharacterized delta-60 repeat protein